MPSILLAACAVCNVSLFLEPQESVHDISWPTHAVIAVPQGWIKPTDHLVVHENGQPILAQLDVAARWPDGSPKWMHAYASFRYVGGKPATYALVKQGEPSEKLPRSPLIVSEKADGIGINTGVVNLFIPRPFAGISLAPREPDFVPSGVGGPSLLDERGVTWHAINDEKTEIVVEQKGPTQVTVKASGWYQTTEKRVEPFCRFVTRITAFANSSIVKVDHATIFAGDMRKHAIAELAFKVPLADVKGFSTSTLDGQFDDKFTAIWFAQLSANRLVTFSQHGPKPLHGAGITEANARSEGWFSAKLEDQRVVLLTKDFWQKFPKEVGIGRDGIIYYAWPRHGEFSKPSEAATRPENLYKFLCFQTGKLLDSRLPSEYFTALEDQSDTTECKAHYARAANLEGVAIHNEFALAFLPGSTKSKDSNDQVARLQRLYAQSPIARVSPEAIAVSGVLGPVAAAGDEFPEVQRAARDGMLGYAHSIERYGDYGWAIYGNTHHEELMNPKAAGVPGGRPSLHRVWNNNHYQHVSTSWRLFALNEDPRLLDWARICTDNYASIGQVRYDGRRGHLDGNNKLQPGPEVKFHNPGAFWHCKAFVPWGGRDFGMDRNDDDSGLTGHWPDPSGLLFAWLFDANRWAKDGYELWLENVKFPTTGTRREINTTLVHAITAYEYQPKPEILAAIKGMARGLTSVPIMDQRPGPLWEPTWLSRYHELFPDDAAFNEYIIQSADAVGVGVESVWSLALCATAYRITKKEEYLRRHAGTLARAVRQVFHDPAPDKRWDNYGFGPGPDRDRHFILQWPRFNAALKDAKIDSLSAPDEPGNYLCGVSRWDNSADIAQRGTKILIWKESTPATLDVQATTLSGGDVQATSLQLLSPQGRALVNVPRIPMSAQIPIVVRSVRPSTWEGAIERYSISDSTPGLYTVLIGSNEIGVFQPLTNHPECQVLKTSKLKHWSDPASFSAKLTRGYLVPLTKARIELTFFAAGDRDGCYVSLEGPRRQTILARYIRAGDSATVTLNQPRGVPGPWLLDAFSDHSGFFRLAISAEVDEPLLFGQRLEDVQLIRQKLGK
ncbi:MAG: hypothetical protein HY288_18950 [Planctomycetia bacterium]|nr:hypothetical protein [Planctomycetia bacterium]